jgi:hypothetical protein
MDQAGAGQKYPGRKPGVPMRSMLMRSLAVAGALMAPPLSGADQIRDVAEYVRQVLSRR